MIGKRLTRRLSGRKRQRGEVGPHRSTALSESTRSTVAQVMPTELQPRQSAPPVEFPYETAVWRYVGDF